MGSASLHIHQISVLDDFGAVIQGMILHLLEPLVIEGNDFLHFNQIQTCFSTIQPEPPHCVTASPSESYDTLSL